uniref:C2H2-type domain-containing protein n=1 Tax=Ciona savignyi TaxID=51511 RepID=H2Z1A7_CIOSA
MATYKVNENGEDTNPEDYVTTSLSSSLQNQLNDPENSTEHNYLVESTVGQNNPSTVITTSTVAQHIGNFNENNVFEISMEKSKQNEDFESMVTSENVLPNNNDMVVIETHNTGLAVQQQNHVNEQEPSEFAVKCLGCLKIFETHDHLARHQKAALSNALSFQCDLCCHSLESKSSLLS